SAYAARRRPPDDDVADQPCPSAPNTLLHCRRPPELGQSLRIHPPSTAHGFGPTTKVAMTACVLFLLIRTPPSARRRRLPPPLYPCPQRTAPLPAPARAGPIVANPPSEH